MSDGERKSEKDSDRNRQKERDIQRLKLRTLCARPISPLRVRVVSRTERYARSAGEKENERERDCVCMCERERERWAKDVVVVAVREFDVACRRTGVNGPDWRGEKHRRASTVSSSTNTGVVVLPGRILEGATGIMDPARPHAPHAHLSRV